jgi:hypothetical protein
MKANLAPLWGAVNNYLRSGGLRFATTTGYFLSNPSGSKATRSLKRFAEIFVLMEHLTEIRC